MNNQGTGAACPLPVDEEEEPDFRSTFVETDGFVDMMVWDFWAIKNELTAKKGWSLFCLITTRWVTAVVTGHFFPAKPWLTIRWNDFICVVALV